MLSTTELLVEHIISGILSLVWILAIVFSVTGLDASVFPMVKEYWALFAIVVTAVAYPIGIFVDTVADKMLDGRNEKIRQRFNLKEDFSMMKLVHEMKDDNVRSYFTYNRFKTRVSRSSMLNFAMMALSIFLFTMTRGSEVGVEQPLKIGLTVLISFSLFSVLAFFLWKEIAHTTYKRAGYLYKEYVE